MRRAAVTVACLAALAATVNTVAGDGGAAQGKDGSGAAGKDALESGFASPPDAAAPVRASFGEPQPSPAGLLGPVTLISLQAPDTQAEPGARQ
jgi:hypothetical protein